MRESDGHLNGGCFDFFLIPSFISNVGDVNESEILDRLTVSASERKRKSERSEKMK